MRPSGVCSCEAEAEGWSELAGIVAAARRRRRGCREQFTQPGGALGSGFGGEGRGDRGGLSSLVVSDIYSGIHRELTPRINTRNGRRDLRIELSAGGDDDVVWAAAVSERKGEGVGPARRSLGGCGGE